MPGHVRKMRYPDSVSPSFASLFPRVLANLDPLSSSFSISYPFLPFPLYISSSLVYESHSLIHRELSIRDAPRQARKAVFDSRRHSPLRAAAPFGEYIMQ